MLYFECLYFADNFSFCLVYFVAEWKSIVMQNMQYIYKSVFILSVLNKLPINPTKGNHINIFTIVMNMMLVQVAQSFFCLYQQSIL